MKHRQRRNMGIKLTSNLEMRSRKWTEVKEAEPYRSSETQEIQLPEGHQESTFPLEGELGHVDR